MFARGPPYLATQFDSTNETGDVEHGRPCKGDGKIMRLGPKAQERYTHRKINGVEKQGNNVLLGVRCVNPLIEQKHILVHVHVTNKNPS